MNLAKNAQWTIDLADVYRAAKYNVVHSGITALYSLCKKSPSLTNFSTQKWFYLFFIEANMNMFGRGMFGRESGLFWIGACGFVCDPMKERLIYKTLYRLYDSRHLKQHTVLNFGILSLRDANQKDQKNQNLGDRQFCFEINSSQPQKWSNNHKYTSNISNLFAKIGQNERENTYFKHFPSYQGDLVLRTGAWEIWSVSGDSRIIRESWHRWSLYRLLIPLAFLF